MASLGDVIAAIRDALIPDFRGDRWFGDKILNDLKDLGSEFKFGYLKITEGGSFAQTREVLGSAVNFTEFSAVAFTDPQRFASEIFEKWDTILREAMGLLNVEIEPVESVGAIDSADAVRVKLERGADEAQKRVTAAIGAINLIIFTGSAVSIAAEAASKGSVRSIAEAIQSWIWANGLGSFSPLGFQPQVNASIMPYLQRHFNARAKAQIPPVTDIIRFQLREVFLAGRREELVGDEPRPVFDMLMGEWGFDKFHADSYWGAHWVLPSQGQLNEMLFRGVIDRAEWERFTRFNDLEPTSIPRVAEIIYNPFTRVDVRRMARFGILDDSELLQAYADIGFFAPTVADASGRHRAVTVSNPDFTIHKAQALVIFTKIFNALPELRQRFAKGWINQEQVLTEIQATGIEPLRARRIMETIVKTDGPARTAPERELSRALIARAWKLRLISFPQGLFLMGRLGWDVAEAELILRVQSIPDDPLAFVDTNLGARLGFGGPGSIPEIGVEQ